MNGSPFTGCGNINLFPSSFCCPPPFSVRPSTRYTEHIECMKHLGSALG